MTTREAAIVSAYTGVLIGELSDMQTYVEEIMGRPVWTHEMGTKAVAEAIREKSKDDFCNIVVEG